MTPAAQAASGILRDPSQFQWYVIPLFAIIVYIYANEIERRRWGVVFAGLAFWGMDWINEIGNGLVLHFSGHAPVWAAPADTAYLILIGLNVEICFMFAIAGVGFAKLLPSDPGLRILGLPNRIFIAAAGSGFCVGVEYGLNSIGALTWDWPWWGRRAPWLIFLLGYLPFFLVAFRVHDMRAPGRQARFVSLLLGADALALLLFGFVLGWI